MPGSSSRVREALLSSAELSDSLEAALGERLPEHLRRGLKRAA